MRRLLRVSRHRLRRSLHWLLAQEGTPRAARPRPRSGRVLWMLPLFRLTNRGERWGCLLIKRQPFAGRSRDAGEQSTHLHPAVLVQLHGGAQLLGPSNGADALSSINRSNLWLQGWDFTQRILLGSSLVGLIVAVVSGLVAYKLFQRRSAQPSRPITVSNQSP